MTEHLMASEAAGRLGVSAKALRLYEQRGLLKPLRTEAGWRVYGPVEMSRAGEIAALRALGLSLAQTARVLAGDAADLEPALAAHQAALEAQGARLAETINRIKAVRADLRAGKTPVVGALAGLLHTGREPAVALDLPWPWGGERFELATLAPLTWLVGPLGSGKTRLAMALGDAIPGARFVGLERAAPAVLTPSVEAALDWLAGEGATRSDGLTILMSQLAAGDGAARVVDLVEQGLDQATQEALAAWLRRRRDATPLILMTRSTAMLDLEGAGDEVVIYCPANHSLPMLVVPRPGAPGYEALEGCLATPEVRARTKGMRAVIAA